MTQVTVVVRVYGPEGELKNNSEMVRKWVEDELESRLRHAPFYANGLTARTLVRKVKGNPK